MKRLILILAFTLAACGGGDGVPYKPMTATFGPAPVTGPPYPIAHIPYPVPPVSAPAPTASEPLVLP